MFYLFEVFRLAICKASQFKILPRPLKNISQEYPISQTFHNCFKDILQPEQSDCNWRDMNLTQHWKPPTGDSLLLLPCFPDSQPICMTTIATYIVYKRRIYLSAQFSPCSLLIVIHIVICDDDIDVGSEFYHSANFSLSTHAVMSTLQMQRMA